MVTDTLTRMALGIIVLIITVSIGAKVLMTLQGTQTSNYADYNVTGDGLTAIGTYSDFFVVIVVIGILSAIVLMFGTLGRQ